MRLILLILLLCSFGADAQMIIKAHANYRPYAQPAANLLLDDYPNAAAAYSLRKLRTAYSGSAIRVRRSNDNAESDIGFTSSGDLDTASLKTFVGSNSGFVVSWYDQSGNGRNLLESTQANQPSIANLGIIYRENGKPHVRFDGSNDRLAINNNLPLTNQTIFACINLRQNYTASTSQNIIWRSDTIVNDNPSVDGMILGASTIALTNERISWLATNLAGGSPYGVGEITTDISSGNHLISAIYNFSTLAVNINRNSSVLSLTNTTTGSFNQSTGYPRAWRRIGSSSTGSNCLQGGFFEFIIYTSNQSSNRTGIENNINDYYNIYWNGDFTGILDTYPNSAAAYSLRNLSSTYKGPLIRVRRSNDNAEQDIFGDYYGNLDTVGLKNFVGANSGFVTTWYDQSGSSPARNTTQGTAANQPRIVNSGVIDRENGKPALIYDGSNDFLGAATASHWEFLHFGNHYTAFTIARAGNVTDPENIYFLWGTTATVLANGAYLAHDTRSSIPRDRAQFHVIGSGANGIVALNAQTAGTTPANTQFLSYLIGNPNEVDVASRSFLATNNGATQYNNTDNAQSSAGNPNHALRIGTAANASGVNQLFLLGSTQEIIFYNSNQATNRTGIQNNINTYYSIY